MNPPERRPRGNRFACLALSITLILPIASLAADELPLKEGSRLSDWLLTHANDPGAYPLGLVWKVPAAREAQSQLKHRLLARLGTENLGESAEARARLSQWIRSLPVTGRVPLPIVDARWLQANPERDPVLDAGHSLFLPQRPLTLTVVGSSALQCAVRHASGTEAPVYLRHALGSRADGVDVAWVVQPDGHVQRANVSAWNMGEQDEPAPGAWIWAPERDANWPSDFSQMLAEFVATQGLSANFLTSENFPASEVGKCDVTAGEVPNQGLRKPARDPYVSSNDWGFAGLMQTPTARMAEAGELRFQYSSVFPYDRGSVVLQPFDWLEGGFRYTNIRNRLYGPASLSGDQSNKDKSLDLKFRLLTETATRPQFAVGIIDLGGTGLFSSEYIVANKRFGDFDFSAGIAWGYLGASGNIKNPFSAINGSFSSRTGNTNASGGTIGINSFFRGPAALFGGIQYQSPINGLLFKLEYDGNNYQREPQSNNQSQGSPINVGAVYRLTPTIDLSAGIERGNTVMFGLTFHGALDKMGVAKPLDATTPRVLNLRPTTEPNWKQTATDLEAQTQWTVRQIQRKGSELNLVLESVFGTYVVERLDKAVAVLHRDAPEGVSRFVFTFTEGGIAFSDWVVLRDEWVAKRVRYRAAAEQFEAIAAAEPRARSDFAPLWTASPNKFTWGYAPTIGRIIGGPDGFLLYHLGLVAASTYRLADDTWIDALIHFRLVDNYDKFKYTAPSNLPRVRTFQREFVTSSRVTIPQFKIMHVGRLSDNQYYSAYAGLLEQQFAGVGGEWLYRPWNSSLAFGIDINRVQQRDFNQDFRLRDYKVSTGHATLYWDTGWENVHANLVAGKYLAADKGITFDLSRQFRNGVTMGAYFTKTNVSSLAFGEGSFDKGIYFSIPFDAMLPYSSPLIANFSWSPLTRDGGQRLWRSTSLYGVTSATDKSTGKYASAGSETWHRLNADEAPDRTPPLWPSIVDSARWLKWQLTSGQNTDAIIVGSAIVLASSALDKPTARWAERHQSARWDSIGKAANYIPLALAATSGLIRFGAGGDVAADTARASLLAVGWTLGIDYATRFTLGRARPDQQLGPANFSGPSKSSSSSGFPSNHMGMAFAAVTPFAQRYDAPWLYAVAAATAPPVPDRDR